MKSYKRLLIFGLAVLALTALVSPGAALLWNHFITAFPPWQNYDVDFTKIFDRIFIVSGVILFFVCRRLLKISVNELGLTPARRAWRDAISGAVISLASMLVLVWLMSLTGSFDPFFRLSIGETLGRCGKALAAAVTVAFIEEIFFRGIIFKGLREDLPAVWAYLFAAAFFSAIHFLQPAKDVAVSAVGPLSGFRHAFESFHGFLDPAPLLPGLLGLALIGFVLCYAFERTGTLYLSMGLHAGWIFGLKSFGVFGRYTREQLGWMFGSTDPKVVSGVISWIGIVAVGLAVHWVTRHRKPAKCLSPSRKIAEASAST
ncbi:MAG TPA: CPBP family intramembrane glutamic endopeptidase [Candidatus Binatia bacterium]